MESTRRSVASVSAKRETRGSTRENSRICQQVDDTRRALAALLADSQGTIKWTVYLGSVNFVFEPERKFIRPRLHDRQRIVNSTIIDSAPFKPGALHTRAHRWIPKFGSTNRNFITSLQRLLMDHHWWITTVCTTRCVANIL